MKQKITLLMLMVLTAMFTFGQNRVQNLSEKQRLDSVIFMEKNSSTGLLENYNKHEYSYNDKEKVASSIYSTWNSTTQAWNKNFRFKIS
ncbi:MAG TPA: DUF3836 domain-containing protein [Paludibacteraceae bacterium]|nr:DUF3836 domain-containing protein [Paludibacteraceae bacterium]